MAKLYLIGICPEDEGRVLKEVSCLFDLIDPGGHRFVELASSEIFLAAEAVRAAAESSSS
jgi:hypothetical protein